MMMEQLSSSPTTSTSLIISSKFPSSLVLSSPCENEMREDREVGTHRTTSNDQNHYLHRKRMNQQEYFSSSSASSCLNNWNVITMRRMISLFLMCGLLMCFPTTASAAATAATAAPINVDDMQAATTTTTQIPGNCSQVKCPPVESCPEDSYRLPSIVEPKKQGMLQQNGGSCCPVTSSLRKCQCIPDLLCSPKECPSGWVPHVSKNATGKPGGCCPKYECMPSSSSGEIKSNHHQQHSHQQHYHAQFNYHNPPEKLHGAQSYHPSTSDVIGLDSSDFSLEDLRGGNSEQDEDEDGDEDDEGDDDLDIDEDSAENLLEGKDKSQNKISPKLLLTDKDDRSRSFDVDDDADDDGHCFHNGKIYKSGESWTVQSECSQCFCQRGLVSCKPIACDVPAECRLARAQPLSCCPVCDGCVSASGKAYNMTEVWQEDPCTNCSCVVGGRIQCHVSMCKRQHSCATPKHYPGECCPRCENEPPDTGYPHPISPSSSLGLSHHDKDSCPFRECHRDINCPNGFRLDKSGCPTCECQKCQSLLECKLSCRRGFQIDGFGCTLCECRGDEANNVLFPSSTSKSRNGNNEANQQEEISSLSSSGSSLDQSSYYSPSVKLDQRNLLGNPGSSSNSNKDLIGRDGHPFQYHDGNRYSNRRQYHRNGNDVLDHDDHDLYGYGYGSNEARSSSSSNSRSSSSSASFCAVDSDGLRRMEGEEWSDHCRRCVCRNGKEMCSLITCQAPKCEHPIFYPGDCCPRCPVEEMSISFSHVNVSVCLSSDGTERIEGEIWTLSSCLTCTCHSGQVLCAAPDCPPTPCSSPKLVDCCLQCPSKKEDEQEEDASSQDKNNKDGQHSVTNLLTSSSSPSNNKNCLSDDSIKTYLNGETWKVGACQSCRCEDGQIQCFSAGKCPPLECSRPVLAKNQCCPICLGKLIEKSVIQHHHHGVEGFEPHHIHGSNSLGHQHQHEHGNSVLMTSSSTTTTTRGPGGAGLEPHCAVLIACLLVVTILLSLYIVRQVCFHRRVSRRLIKKVPVGFHSSSSSSHSPSVTPDCCYKCDYSKYCDSGGCVIVGGGGGGGGSSSVGGSRCGGASSRTSSTNGSNGHLSSEQKPLFQNNEQEREESQSVSSSVIPCTPTPPPPSTQQNLLRDSDKV